jgi:ribosomal protein S18 acetylase RimI-like enzyme
MFVDVGEDDAARQAMLASLGFARHGWYQLHLTQPLDTPIPPGDVPAGYGIRPLAGEAEVEGYVALHRTAFGSENMSAAWRRQTLATPQYRAGLDLVAVAPDGRLAGFCIGWLASVEGRVEAQIEPLGVHPDAQGRGLGRALILEALRRFRVAGAVRAHIEVDGDNDAARGLYVATGFRPSAKFLKYGLKFGRQL